MTNDDKLMQIVVQNLKRFEEETFKKPPQEGEFSCAECHWTFDLFPDTDKNLDGELICDGCAEELEESNQHDTR